MNQTILIYDLDDTLIDTSDVYYSTRKKFLYILGEQGISSEDALELFESIDTGNVEIYGHKPERYKISMLETYEVLCKKYQIPKSVVVSKDLEKCGSAILEKMPELIDDAIALLSWGHKKYKQVLFTRGIESLQVQKIRYAGLSEFFDIIKVVSTKNTDILKILLKEIGTEKYNCWVIGDSIKSDINPAIELGLNCILYLYEHHSYFWQQEYGYEAKGSFYCVKRLLEVKDVIENPSNFEKVRSVKLTNN
jgi:putative hydrolase of the HAD superfamily